MSTTRSLMRLCGKLALASAVFACSVSPAVGKEFYRWVDEAGVTHYSAHPPRNRPATRVHATNTQAEVTNAAPADKADAEQEAKKTQTAASTAAPEPDPERCETARANLKAMQENARVRILENGEYRYLTPAEMAESLQTAQEIINQDC